MSTDIKQRKHNRVPLKVDLSSKLLVGEDARPLKALGVDASPIGIGIVSFEELPVGTRVALLVAKTRIEMQVIWCRADSVRGKVFHMGLETQDHAADVTKLLSEEGLLPKAPPSGRPTAPKLALDFSTISQISANVNMSDQKLLASTGLGRLAETHRCFPVHHEGASLCLLIPNEWRARDIGEKGEEEVRRRVLVLQRVSRAIGTVSWLKIWPN